VVLAVQDSLENRFGNRSVLLPGIRVAEPAEKPLLCDLVKKTRELLMATLKGPLQLIDRRMALR